MKILVLSPPPPAILEACALLAEAGMAVETTEAAPAASPEGLAAAYDIVAGNHPGQEDLLARMRAHPEAAGLPWAAWGPVERAREALDQGADVYLDPGESPDLLAARLQALARRARLGGAPRRDPLTGLVGKRSFTDILRQEFERAARHRRCLALLALEPDLQPGHPGAAAEEPLLQELGRHLRQWVRDSDLLARLSGHRFGVVLPETDANGGLVAGQRLQSAMEGTSLCLPPAGKAGAGRHVRLTLSIGLAAYPSRGMDRPRDLLGRALESLVQAQRRGGNAVLPFGASDIIWSREAPDPSRI